ncbi:aspartate kinase [Pontibacter sp. G13]|uniref:aspartate kinase n=1 Tax=Pontibacter sp. G13 TaxID=3074898 RepID=UPI0028898762|nr:aspartate kinase [Pontibacter sp. G13]WNJ18754.1 aspartate kinase [Pontibacter sp. G13]
MLVMKFGGASVKHADAVRNVADIISHHQDKAQLVVISAMDKTTNHLELLAHLARDGKETEALEQFERVKRFHRKQISDLFPADQVEAVEARVTPFFTFIERIVNGILLLEEFPPRTYDRIVSCGELLSTTIVSSYLSFKGLDCEWIDAREVVKTDATWKQAGVIWTLTEENVKKQVKPKMKGGRVLVTQGFIGSTTEGHTTTLGREGSDYTGSIFAHCLEADSLTVWKDVPGILNGDPRIRQDTVKLDKLSYEEAVEMTFYGASVIHPKTIKPIFNRQIPLHVKCFLDVELEGSTIGSETNSEAITSYIVKKDQVFYQIKPKDFSFMEERLMQEIFDYIYKSGVKVNLVQNSAISLMICVDNRKSNNHEFVSLLLDKFEVQVQEDLKLYTMINFSVKNLKEAADAVMVQQHGNKLFVVK